MQVRLLAIGTRGDVQPYVALGRGLQRAGFKVSLATTADFRRLVESYGLESLTMELDLHRAVSGPRGGRRAAKWAVFRMLLSETVRLSRGADCLIYSPTTTLTVPHVAEKLGIPAFPALLQPYVNPTRSFPAVIMPALPLGGRLGERYNLLTYRAFEGLTWTFVGRQIQRWQQETLGLPPSPVNSFALIREWRTPTFYGISPSVLPRPPEWGDHVHLTGYWFTPAEGAGPSEELRAFLAAGEPPVFVGFGSIAGGRPEKTAAIVLEAVRRASVRAVLATGWGGLSVSYPPDDVLLVGDAPYYCSSLGCPRSSTTAGQARRPRGCVQADRRSSCPAAATSPSGDVAWSGLGSGLRPCLDGGSPSRALPRRSGPP
jgi:sterol 3beta-glucosyltransferase